MSVFKSCGIRGLYGDELTPAVARDLGQAVGTVLDGGRVVMGGDARPSTPILLGRPEPAVLEKAAVALERLIPEARQQGIELVCMMRGDVGNGHYFERLRELAGPDGFDDIVVVAANAEVITEAAPLLAHDGVLNVFAGLPRGTTAQLDLSAVALHNGRFIGSSGSRITDMQRVPDKLRDGQLATRRSVAAISGIVEFDVCLFRSQLAFEVKPRRFHPPSVSKRQGVP